MTVEPREDQPRIGIVTRSGTATGNDKADGRKEVEATWIRKATKKAHVFDILKEKQAFTKARQSFMDDGASTSTTQLTQKDNHEIVPVATQEVDPNVLKSSLQTCMKLLRNQKVVDGL